MSSRLRYIHNALTYIKAELKVAKDYSQNNKMTEYNIVINKLRDQVNFLSDISLLDYDKAKLLLQILDRKIKADI